MKLLFREDPSESRPLSPSSETHRHVLEMVTPALQRHLLDMTYPRGTNGERSTPVPNQLFRFPFTVAQPWLMPCCNPPSCRCTAEDDGKVAYSISSSSD